MLVLALAIAAAAPPDNREDAFVAGVIDAGDAAVVPVGFWITGDANKTEKVGCTPTAPQPGEPAELPAPPSVQRSAGQRSSLDALMWAFGVDGGGMLFGSSWWGPFTGTMRGFWSAEGATIRVSMNGYDDAWIVKVVHADRIDLIPETKRYPPITLRRCRVGADAKPAPSYQALVITRPAADVTIDGVAEARGTLAYRDGRGPNPPSSGVATETRVVAVAPGIHRLHVHAADYDDVDQEIIGRPGVEPRYFSLVPRFGMIAVRCAGEVLHYGTLDTIAEGSTCPPGGAGICDGATSVTIDGVARSCGTFRATPGPHIVHATRAHFAPHDETVVVNAAAMVDAMIDFKGDDRSERAR